MGSVAIFYRRRRCDSKEARSPIERSYQIDIAIGLLAASAIVAQFVLSYMAFGDVEMAR
jgi:hypothetical protein